MPKINCNNVGKFKLYKEMQVEYILVLIVFLSDNKPSNAAFFFIGSDLVVVPIRLCPHIGNFSIKTYFDLETFLSWAFFNDTFSFCLFYTVADFRFDNIFF